jgi:single-strand DNA-binding protein
MFNKLIRLGRDAELRTTQSNKQVLGFAGAYDVGFGDNKKTQWIDCSLWGDRAVKLEQYMKKGSQVVIYADDLQIEEYPKNDGTTGVKLKCRIVNVDLAGSSQSAAPQAPQAPAYQNVPQAPQAQPANNFDNFDSDIPF